MSLSEEAIKEFQEIYKKVHGKELPHDEAADGARRLMHLVEILADSHTEEQRRKKKLEEFPKGFHLDGVGYTCFICSNSTSQGQSWYDGFGIKCTTCQGAIDRKEIPASLAKNKEGWYSEYDIESRFNIKSPTLRSWIKKGILKARVVTDNGKGIHARLFLIKDNKDTLPPKKLTESQMVAEAKNGNNIYHLEPWYRFVDPHEHLKGYKIMDYLAVIRTGKESEKTA